MTDLTTGETSLAPATSATRPTRATMLRRWLLLLGIGAAVLLVDQASKAWILAHLALGESVAPIPALADVFRLTLTRNTGSAFGLLPQAGGVLLVLAVVVTAGLIVFYPRLRADARLTRLGLALIIGGALGNALDRVQYGAVIDFIHYTLPGVVSNVSNLADHAIVLGVILTFIDAWRTDVRRNRERAELPGQTDQPTPAA